MKLHQAQVWKSGDQYLRIVQVERLAVGYKSLKKLSGGDGPHLRATKKEFCRLVKTATLLTPEQVQALSAK
jgi:hypothetical protein